MMPSHSGSIRLFRFAGIQVYLHWWWFLAAAYEISSRMGTYGSPAWNVAEYLMLFVIVTLHEFGHALACRQTGGQASEIVLWPLGGVAYVAPPPRAGANLWSIAAGPLVNVVLVPILFGAIVGCESLGWTAGSPDLLHFLTAVFRMNLGLLIFNLLPVYPLDGGQILRSLLWFGFGRARSLQIAAVLGIASIIGGVGLLLWLGGTDSLVWTAIMALFLGQRCWVGLREAKIITALERMPRHTGFACPSCHTSPPGGPLWGCRSCRKPFDPFSTNAVCPHCGTVHPTTMCAHCGASHPIDAWRVNQPPPLV
jgi:Zn-dependent protease